MLHMLSVIINLLIKKHKNLKPQKDNFMKYFYDLTIISMSILPLSIWLCNVDIVTHNIPLLLF